MNRKIKFSTLTVLILISTIIIVGCNKHSTNEEDFIAKPNTDISLNDGRFYLNGDINNCYFNIHNGHIQFIVGDTEQMQVLYDLTSENVYNFSNAFQFEEYCEQLQTEWENPIPYIITITALGRTDIGWNVIYSETDGSIVSYSTAYYIDENNFESNGCTFTRIAGEIHTN